MRRHHHGRAPSPYAGRTAAPLSAEVILVRNFDSKVNPTRPARQSPLATSQFQGMPLDLIERVRSFPLFQSAPDSFLVELGTLLKPQMHSVNDYIMTEGEDAKAMYWIVRGAVAVTSRDGESNYAELEPGAFIGEIGILLDRPRTATVVARTRCLTLQLKGEDLRKILPKYPEVERAIREEALERLSILEKKKKQQQAAQGVLGSMRRGSKRPLEAIGEEMEVDEQNGASKRRKSPSPGMGEIPAASALGHGLVNVRALLMELPLFASLPQEMLHFLGLNAQPQTFPPFTEIIKQDTTGREVFFIIRGEVEVLDERIAPSTGLRRSSRQNGVVPTSQVKARLKGGQYFGEVVSLSLADHRTATVRSVTQVECLVITENVLAEFWRRCPPDVRQQIEDTARLRLETASPNDVVMADADTTPSLDDLVIGEIKKKRTLRQRGPRIMFNDPETSKPHEPAQTEMPAEVKPLDPDPFQSVGLENVRMRSRRSSLAPPSPDEPIQSQKVRRSPRGSPTGSPIPTSPSTRGSRSGGTSPIPEEKYTAFPFSDPFTSAPRPKPRPRPTLGPNRGTIPDQILPLIFQYLGLHELMRLQAVSIHWQNILSKSPILFHNLDLSRYNRTLTDSVIINRICPFIGQRPRLIDISNCFHLTDEGFTALATHCGHNVQVWRMKSVWDVTAPAILEMSNRARSLREVDLSNCRKVSDTLLARIVGWVVPNNQPNNMNNFSLNSKFHTRNRSISENQKRPESINTRFHSSTVPNPSAPAPGTVFGCPDLSKITLSYCKHITDRTMHHIATHAAKRVESMDFTRCTTITDMGFQYWGNVKFERLRKLCLADCTYLSDQAIVWLVNGAGGGLRVLDLVCVSILPLFFLFHCTITFLYSVPSITSSLIHSSTTN